MSNDKKADAVATSGVQFLEMSEDQAGRRLDNYLLSLAKSVPKSRIYRAIRSGEVRINKGRTKAAYRLVVGDIVRVPPLQVRETTKVVAGEAGREAILGAILEKHKGFFALHKPSGWAVHGGSGISLGVIETLRQALPAEPYLELVHRLDRDTSGCLIIARKRSFLRELHRQIRENEVHKRYLMLVQGHWDYGRYRCEVHLHTHRRSSGERHVQVDPDGKYCRSDFRPVEFYQGATLIEARLHTGRTHQLRVHCAHLGHPIAGDDKYGDPAFNKSLKRANLSRMFLHSSSFGFEYPEGNPQQVDAPLGESLSRVLESLDRSAALASSKDGKSSGRRKKSTRAAKNSKRKPKINASAKAKAKRDRRTDSGAS